MIPNAESMHGEALLSLTGFEDFKGALCQIYGVDVEVMGIGSDRVIRCKHHFSVPVQSIHINQTLVLE